MKHHCLVNLKKTICFNQTRKLNCQRNLREVKLKKLRLKEATTASSSGPYDAPFGGPKKDPLKLSNPDTVEKELRSVRDKNFPKYGGPGGKFVKIKNKCKTFPLL